MRHHFFTTTRLLEGPWQAFERDVARLLLHNGFKDVKVVGRTGDMGADILATNSKGLWVIQCKHTTASHPPKEALDEVVEAGKFYGADELCVAVSRPCGLVFESKRNFYKNSGLNIRIWAPSQLLQLAEKGSQFTTIKKALRPYQLEAVEKLRNALVDTGKGQLVMATGMGKTVVMASVVQDLFETGVLKNNRVLVLAHMRDLVTQLHTSFWSQLSIDIQTQQLMESEFPTQFDGITFATIQSAKNCIDKLPKYDLILVDEAHHIGADTFRDFAERAAPTMLAGATATPWRGDGFDIDEILGPPVVKLGIADGLSKGFLSEVDYRIFADNIDWDIVQQKSINRYSLKQLNRKLLIPTRDEQAASIISKIFINEKRKSGIVFCPTIVHARHFSSILRSQGMSCEIIASDIDKRELAERLARFKKGLFNIAITIDMFNEGMDVPDVDMIIFMRTTHSRRIFVQQLGRGLRISKDKDKVIVLDFVTDLRRMAEVLELDSAVKSFEIEKIGLGQHLVEFANKTAGGFLQEWILDQADLILNESSTLDLPQFEFPLTN